MKKTIIILLAAVSCCVAVSCGTGSKALFFTDFNEKGGIPDPKVWTLCEKGPSNWNRKMSGSYDQAYVEDGNLILKAEIIDGEYYTGGIHSKNKKSFRNARVDIRAKFIRTGAGSFPALWMMPQTPVYPSWPSCGEIDIMEQLNNDTIVYQTVHSYYKTEMKNTDPAGHITKEYNPQEYNIYSVTFDNERITFYVNDAETFYYPNLHLEDEAGKKQWPFSTDWYLILNYALGGENSWAGPIDDSALPYMMAVDWIKVTSLK